MPSTIPAPFLQHLRLLIRANHILHFQGLADAFGHVSIRHPMDKKQYIIAAYDPGAPALVKSREDFIAYWVADSSPVDPSAPQGYSERFIHGEIYLKFPHAKCVVHSHSDDVVPFTVGRHGVRPVYHMAGFMGADACPTYHASSTYSQMTSHEPDMLIKNAQLGAALAAKLSDEQPVVLQAKHGFTTFGNSVEQAIYRAVYMQANCKLLAKALATENLDWERVSFLSTEEARACRVMNEKCEDKSWRLWVREVQVNRLYENEEGEPEKSGVKGMKMRKEMRKKSSRDGAERSKKAMEGRPATPVVVHQAKELPMGKERHNSATQVQTKEPVVTRERQDSAGRTQNNEPVLSRVRQDSTTRIHTEEPPVNRAATSQTIEPIANRGRRLSPSDTERRKTLVSSERQRSTSTADRRKTFINSERLVPRIPLPSQLPPLGNCVDCGCEVR